jgi:hypothetical protein
MSGQHDEHGRLDPRLRAQLETALPEAPLDEVDWEALRREIALGAAPLLARLRAGGRARAWWEYEARWAARALPAAIAAAAALVLLLGRLQRTTADSTDTAGPTASAAAVGAAAQPGLEAAIGTGSNEAAVLYASADQDVLLRAAVSIQ